MGRRRTVTSVQIAREAGVAQSTVSRVLNGGSVSEETRRRVLDVVAKYDFQPSQAARSLVGTRSGLIGVVIRDLTNPFYPVMVKAVERVLHQQGLRLSLVTDVMTPEEGLALLRREGVDGVVFASAIQNDPLAHRMLKHGIPVVLCHRTLEDFPADQVEADNATAGRLAADHLLDLGHRHFGMVCGSAGASTAQQRGAAFRDRLQAHGGLTLTEVDGDYDYATAYDAVRTLLSGDRRPTALFCHNDIMAYAALNAAAAAGVRVPDELSVVGCDDVPLSAWERIDLTTVRQPLERIAQVGVELLVQRLDEPDLPPRREVLPVEFVERSTTAPASRV
ncbi:LacI family DNA-binding transcriptional regulator [Streptomyces thermodiastaticus]|uniref:LacI family DNA-binding transcriptional regulator n=1 Tax=Streptomyces thermodiastaticus TaxID=44061 RepID=UPI0016790F6C|nr:LacI family DNA-binding transcriptional regulator [Streptomyces thermodiastaticus]MCE7550997.1 LacI family transcriptional regulator [Streptomyces thermodiastaticus]GHF57911.1 LacI family transcriptional regulator [Streptomyces thermodiastaticus]